MVLMSGKSKTGTCSEINSIIWANKLFVCETCKIVTTQPLTFPPRSSLCCIVWIPKLWMFFGDVKNAAHVHCCLLSQYFLFDFFYNGNKQSQNWIVASCSFCTATLWHVRQFHQELRPPFLLKTCWHQHVLCVCGQVDVPLWRQEQMVNLTTNPKTWAAISTGGNTSLQAAASSDTRAVHVHMHVRTMQCSKTPVPTLMIDLAHWHKEKKKSLLSAELLTGDQSVGHF